MARKSLFMGMVYLCNDRNKNNLSKRKCIGRKTYIKEVEKKEWNDFTQCVTVW